MASSDQDIRAADDAGKLRIIDIQPRRIRLAGKVCVVVAGVAPSTEAERFEAAIVTKRAFADNAQALLTRAVAEAHAANEQAALKRYEADTAKLTGQSNATQLDTVASAEKPKVQLSETQKANRQKELLDAKKDLAAAIEERTASRRRLKSRCS